MEDRENESLTNVSTHDLGWFQDFLSEDSDSDDNDNDNDSTFESTETSNSNLDKVCRWSVCHILKND